MVSSHDCGGGQIVIALLIPTSGYSEIIGGNGRINVLVAEGLKRLDF